MARDNRRSAIDDLAVAFEPELVEPAREAGTASEAQEPEAAIDAPHEPKRRGPRPSGQRRHHTSVYIPEPVFERFREIGFRTRRKVNDLILDAFDRYMETEGFPERCGHEK